MGLFTHFAAGALAGMAPDPENLLRKLGRLTAILIVSLGLFGLILPEAASAQVRRETPVMGKPQVAVVSSDWQHTVLRIDFPLVSFGGDWSAVDPLQVEYALPFVFEDSRVENARRLPPRLPVTVAVPTRRAVITTVLDRSWWREPERPVADVELADFDGPAVYRSVPLSGTLIPLGIGGGVLRSLTVAITHAPTETSLDYLAAALSEPLDQAAAAAISRGPANLVNADRFDDLARAARTEAVARTAATREKAAELDPFAQTGNWLRLLVDESGIYSVSGQDLSQAEVDLGEVNPASVRLYRGGGLPLAIDPTVTDEEQPDRVGLNEVAILVLGGQDGDWNLDDEIRFYGVATSDWRDRFDPEALPLEHYDHPFAAAAVYWLTWEDASASPLPGTPLRIAAEARPAVGVERVGIARLRRHFEEQRYSDMGLVEDNWVWYNSINSSQSVRFELAGVVPDRTARYVVDFRGRTDERSFSSQTIDAAAWANGIAADAVTTSFYVSDQEDSLRVRLGGDFVPLPDGENRITLQNASTWSGHRSLALDSADVLYWADLDLSGWAGQLEFAYWKDLVGGAGEQIDLEVAAPTGETVQLWDVSVPAEPRLLTGSASQFETGAWAFGLTLDPALDRHFVAASEERLLTVKSAETADPVVLRAEPTDLDYVLVYAAPFAGPARELADFRAGSLPDTDAPAVAAIEVQDIYDNYSGGQKDWRAIRNYLRDVYENGGHRLRYVCLLGNASRDYRNYTGQTPLVDLFVDFVPTDVRTVFPENPTNLAESPYASDDGLVSFEASPVNNLDTPALGVGRLPAATLAEAELMVRTAIDWVQDPAPGAWRNSVLMVADDLARPNPFRDPASNEERHTEEAEWCTEHLIPTSLDVAKIYGLAYDFPPGGLSKPEVKAHIKTALNEGTTIFHYIGHGAPDNLADERIFELGDVGSLTNGSRRSVFLAFSCDVGMYDSTRRRSMAEEFLTTPNGGAAASICASQVSYSDLNDLLTNAFYEELFPGRRVTNDMGLARVLQLAKARMSGLRQRRNSQRFNLLGDPACVFPHPPDDLVFSAASLDTIEAGMLHTVALEGSQARLKVAPGDSYDLRVEESSHNEYYNIVSYINPDSLNSWVKAGSSVFRGSGTATSAALTIPFVAPAQVRYGDDGRVRLLVESEDGYHAGEMRVPAVRATTATSDDRIGPQISLTFSDGVTTVLPGAELSATLTDPNGIAILGTSPGNSILLEFDETGFMSNVTESFRYEADSYQTGRIDLTLPGDMETGAHKVALHASDAMGNVGSDTLSFHIGDVVAGGMESVALFPNPTSGPCRLVFILGEPMELQWDIYSLAGSRLRSITRTFDSAGPASIGWDGRDREADEIANGTYLYVLRGRALTGGDRPVTRTGKLVIMK